MSHAGNVVPSAPTLTRSAAGQVVRSVIWGQPVYFTITNRRDTIQKQHYHGRFYELEELEIIRQWCPPGGVFCDIGANIGNHALFALKFLHPTEVILFEPNQVAIDVLLSNLNLNGVAERCDLSHLGIGLSDTDMAGMSVVAPGRNLGAGRMVQTGGALAVRRGDSALAGRHVDFLKIDVEGMEVSVLNGLSATIAACRPRMFVEVDQANRAGFLAWTKEHQYAVRGTYKRYRTNENFLIVPEAALPVQDDLDGGV
jgi:FkbM family methyltransferase